MEYSEDVGKPSPGRGDEPLDELLVAPAAILEGLPDAVVASSRDGQIVFMNALAEALFGYPRDKLLGQPVQTLWPERVRDRYTRNMQLYFSSEHHLRFSTEAWGLRRDGSEFVGEMTWGVIDRPLDRCCSRSGATSRSGARPSHACGLSRGWVSGRWQAPTWLISPSRRSS